MGTILHQLGLVAVTLVLMSFAAFTGVAWGIPVLAYVGGYAVSRYDPGAKPSSSTSP